ncbi:hypothetical protein [Streptomyces sp. SID13031]|uniref:hypothetical protein n=1 Tax=Streptomyces sp. SID13031 TaxID=2706046 RepID=UPI0013CC338D|nr:hypothetical protein [Streptomyces sp. SID13031]NEA33397.1 hypothetical protein [Streptomyces sp. SID13031]
MTSWPDDYDSEAYYDTEDYDTEDYDSGDYDSEATRADALRKREAEARRIVALRQKSQRRPGVRAPVSRRVPASRRATPATAVAAVRNLDLETKVGQDSLRRGIEQANARSARARLTAMASLGVDQALDTFGEKLKEHEFVRAGLRLAPLALLGKQHTKPGAAGWLLSPQVIGVASVAGIVAAGHFFKPGASVSQIDLTPRKISAAGAAGPTAGKFKPRIKDTSGNLLNLKPFAYDSDDDKALVVEDDGTFTVPPGTSAKTVTVTVTVGDRVEPFVIAIE